MGIAIEVLPIGPVAVAARTWRHRGRRLITAIVKATFDLALDRAMTPAAPLPIVSEERHYRNNPVASLVRGSDLALLVPRPEVVVVGSAYAAPGQRVTHTSVRVAVQRDKTMLINKRLDVLGDRRARPGAQPPEPEAFDEMPIHYERALGGIASRENPVGVGMAIDADGLLTMPNVQLASGQGGPTPAGLGPIPSAWPARQKRRGSLSWTMANQSLDVEVPDDFDDAYFQTALSDQRVDELQGGELVAIVNMHPEHATIRTYLPMVRGAALAQTASGERLPFRLRMDTVHFEPSAMRAEIVFRGALVISEAQLASVRLAGALETAEQPAAFPDLSTVGGLIASPLGKGSAPDLGSTAVIEVPSDGPGGRPHSSTQVLEVEPPPVAIRNRQSSPGDARQPGVHPLGKSGTMVMEPEPPKMRPVLSGAAADPRPGPPQTVSPSANDRRSGTMVIEPDEPPPQSLPFQRDRRKRRPSGERAAVVAQQSGTPWSPDLDKPKPVALPEPALLTATLDIAPPSVRFGDEPTETATPSEMADAPTVESTPKTPLREAEIAAPPSPSEPKAPPPSAPKDPWAKAEPLPEPPPKPAARVPEVKRANFKNDLYKKLKR